jgi:gluconate 5-dehydrogenase
MFDLTGQTALVTGASSGLGLEIARALAGAGARVFLNSRSEANARKAAQAVGAQPLVFDATDIGAGRRAVERLNDGAKLDILVNNAGVRRRRDLAEFEDADVADLLHGNVAAPFALIQAAGRGMAARGYGRILNVTSVAGPLAQATDTAYAASKGGLDALTRAAAAALGPRGVTVNALAPGFFRTAANEEASSDPDIARWLKGRTALGRWGEPREVAGAALFLCSREAGFVTGQTLFVDGGMVGHY